MDLQVGSTITDGVLALRLTERSATGWRGYAIPVAPASYPAGSIEQVPDGQLWAWRHVPFEWRPMTGTPVEERYVWAPSWRALEHEIRKAVPA